MTRLLFIFLAILSWIVPNVPEPTIAPTIAPTIIPTMAPTIIPTMAPTRTPTMAPTRTPTIIPTRIPTKTPTVEPTVKPTAPSSEPSSQPSSLPSGQPSSQPSSQPSRYSISFDQTNILTLIYFIYNPGNQHLSLHISLPHAQVVNPPFNHQINQARSQLHCQAPNPQGKKTL